MPLSLFKDLSRPKLVDIVMVLKRTCGMSVNEMAAALRMSYMGVKQHCVHLEKKGYLDTYLRPKKAGGRPEKMYRLTGKMDALFPNVACDLVVDMLQAAEASGGMAMAMKLLEHHYQQKGQRYASLVKGRTLLEKAQAFAKIRQSEDCVSTCEFTPQDGLRIVEYHSPIGQLSRMYPKAAELEVQMIATILNCAVERAEQRVDRVTRYEFRLKAKQG